MKIANYITILRIFLSPLFLLFFTINTAWALFACIILAGILELSDFFDGHIARKRGQITDFGKLMDPFADSIARFTIFLCFLGANLAPIWMIAIFFYRDVLVSVIRVFSMKAGIVVAARKSGKTKAWVQGGSIFVVLAILFFQKIIVLPDFLMPPHHVFVTTLVIGSAAIVTIWSAYDYWQGNKNLIMSSLKE